MLGIFSFYINLFLLLMFKRSLKIYLTILLLIISLLGFSQDPALQLLKQKDIDKLNKEIYKSLRKSQCSLKEDNIRLISFFNLCAKDVISEKEFEDTSFLKKFTYLYCQSLSKRKQVLKANTCICSNDKKIVAVYSCELNYLSDYEAEKMDYYREVIEYVWDKKAFFIFSTEMAYPTYFIITENGEVNVLYHKEKDVYEIIPIRELIEREDWNELSRIRKSR